MHRAPLHRARVRARLPLWAVLAPIAVSVLLVGAALSARLTTAAPAPAPGRTVTVTAVRTAPGPTVTISYLIEVTVTPGRNGF